MKEKQQFINNMTTGPLLPILIRFAVPVVLGNILQAFYTIADMIIVGHYLDAYGLSAVGIGGILMNALMMVSIGLGCGGQILLSQQVGANAGEKLKKTIGTFMTMNLVSALFFGIVGSILTRPLLQLLNTPGPVYVQTKSYYLICCAGIVFIYGYNCVCAVLRGLGQSRLPMIIIAAASVTNVVLDILFIGSMEMGVAGAALATVIAQGIGFFICIFYLIRCRKQFGFDFRLKSFVPDREYVRIITRLSLPLIGFSLIVTISGMFVNSNINAYGVAASAVDGIGNKINMVVNAISMGLYIGSGTIIGQCFGAGKIKRIKQAFSVTVGLSLAIWAVISACMLVFDREIFMAFTKDSENLRMAKPYMKIAVLAFLPMALGTGGFALVEGIGNTDMEMICGVLELALRITLGIVLGRGMGVYGYWIGSAVSPFLTFFVELVYMLRGKWAERKHLL